MNIKIYRPLQPKPPKPPEAPVLRLALVKRNEGVSLHAVDESGRHLNGGYLLSITPRGQIMRSTGISKDLGLPLDNRGRLQMIWED